MPIWNFFFPDHLPSTTKCSSDEEEDYAPRKGKASELFLVLFNSDLPTRTQLHIRIRN